MLSVIIRVCGTMLARDNCIMSDSVPCLMLFDRLADGIQNHAKTMVIVWIVILLVSAPFALKSGDVMVYDLESLVPKDTESSAGDAILIEHFMAVAVNNGSMPILVIEYADGSELEATLGFMDVLISDLESREEISMVLPMDPTSDIGPGVVIATIVPNIPKSEVMDFTPDLRSMIAQVADDAGFGLATYVTGTSPLNYDMSVLAAKDMMTIDPFAVLMILILIGLFFRSFVSSAVPPTVIGVAFVVTLGILFFIGQIFTLFYITNLLILVTMMGVGCDYCIFIIARYREGLRNGLEHYDAVHQAAVWAGESIFISGMTAVIGFGSISFSSYSLISMIGLCLAIGVLIALIAALTLIPAILQIVGDRIFWPTRREDYCEGGKTTRGWYAWFTRRGESYFERSSRFSLRHAKAIAIATVLISVPAVYVVSQSEDSYDIMGAFLGGESKEGIDLIGEYSDRGMIMPNYSIVEFDAPIAQVNTSSNGLGSIHWNDHWDNDVRGSLEALCQKMMEDPNIAYADIPFQWDYLMELIDEEGIEDTDEKIQFIREHLSTVNRAVFDFILKSLDELEIAGVDITKDILFDGFGGLIDRMMYEQAGLVFDWDGAVEEIRSRGVTDPDKIVDIIASQLTTEQRILFNIVINTLNYNGISNDILVSGPGVLVDYLMNIDHSTIGGDFASTGTGTAIYVRLVTATVDDAMSPKSMESINRIADVMDGYKADNPTLVVNNWDTGSALKTYEVSIVVESQFTLIEILVVVMIILILLAVMRSYAISLRSVFTILMSVFWTLAITHILFVDILGEEIIWILPILLLVICLGLGMDYDILLTTRIRENVMVRGMTNDEAIHHAVNHTGSVITLCGVIMGGALGMLMLSNVLILKEFGFALCFALLTDALIVRTYIVPAIMHLLGDYNWIGPGVRLKKKE